jgi:biopolymer transport protein ExbD
MNLFKTEHFHHLPRRHHQAYNQAYQQDKPGINLYPLLGILLVILVAVLAYGATYLLLS